MALAKTREIIIEPIEIHYATIKIVGDGELILNKLDNVSYRQLADKQSGRGKQKIEKRKDPTKEELCEALITSLHWEKGLPDDIDYSDDETELLHKLLSEQRPCISGFGLFKSFQSAINHNEFDKNSKGLQSTMNVVDTLVPVNYVEHYVREPIISSFNGTFWTRQHTFKGWSAEFTISYNENRYSTEQIINIIKYAGFGEGIGSGRGSGYGRYHIEEVK